eukprot:TRINITY_DN40151_c0_g1_i1.p1 TRINITY_DN40151_c0_g1~~TRINITY_DN40151_c0_g1_i1.p1  ORF type:complete len:187 (-),score=31.04 TRINITY_DN40151_c0_g1_i1:293-853(-)
MATILRRLHAARTPSCPKPLASASRCPISGTAAWTSLLMYFTSVAKRTSQMNADDLCSFRRSGACGAKVFCVDFSEARRPLSSELAMSAAYAAWCRPSLCEREGYFEQRLTPGDIATGVSGVVGGAAVKASANRSCKLRMRCCRGLLSCLADEGFAPELRDFEAADGLSLRCHTDGAAAGSRLSVS